MVLAARVIRTDERDEHAFGARFGRADGYEVRKAGVEAIVFRMAALQLAVVVRLLRICTCSAHS